MDNFQAIKSLYSWMDQREWSVQSRNTKTILINNYTHQQFTSQKIIIHSEQIKYIYQARANYPLPFTPKLIISESQNDKRFLNLLVQRGSSVFSEYLKQISNHLLILKIFKEILILLMVLTKRYGFFRITINMIKVTNLGFFQVWINEFEESCHRQFPLNSGNNLYDCKTMISDLTNIFIQNGFSQLFAPFLKKLNSESTVTFQSSKASIQKMMKEGKSLLTPRKSLYQSRDYSNSNIKSELPSFLKKKTSSIKNPSMSPVLKNSIKQGFTGNVELKNETSLKRFSYKQNQESSHVSSCKVLKSPSISQWPISKYIENVNFQKSIKRRSTKSNEKKKYDNYSRRDKNMSIQTPQNSSNEKKIEMNSKSLLVEKNGNKGIRDSGDSLVTKFYHSTQEGSIKNSELSNNSERKGRTSITKKFEDLYQSREDEKYQIRYSSIMEEKGEDGPLSMQNYSKSDIDSKNNRESEIEKDLANLLDSEQVSPRRPSVRRQDHLVGLQQQMNNILLS